MTTPIPGLPVPPRAASGLLLAHYSSVQRSVATQAALAIVNLWNRYIAPARFADSWDRLHPLIAGIILTHYDATAANAAAYYGHARVTAGYPAMGIPGAHLDAQQLEKVLGSMGPGQFFHFLKEEDPDQASTMARDALKGAGTRLVMNGGRETIVKAAGGDGAARGWERVIEPGACSFCAMLAGRGGVYTEATASFRAHDHDHCVARPVFAGQKSVNEELSQQWGEVTKGKRGAAARAAWDEHWSSHGGIGAAEAKEPTADRPGSAAIPAESVGQPAIPH